MFSSHERLRRRTRPGKDLNRADYLQALVSEFQDTADRDARDQVLANLANFAYDPINFPILRRLNALDLFIDCIDADEDLAGNTVRFGVAALCNLAADPVNRDLVLADPGAVGSLVRCLTSSRVDTVTSALTTLMQLITAESRARIVSKPLVECVRQFTLVDDARLRNLAAVFLVDHCAVVAGDDEPSSDHFLHIPLPPSAPTDQ